VEGRRVRLLIRQFRGPFRDVRVEIIDETEVEGVKSSTCPGIKNIQILMNWAKSSLIAPPHICDKPSDSTKLPEESIHLVSPISSSCWPASL